jgi:tRNA dimethylallyltransferase
MQGPAFTGGRTAMDLSLAEPGMIIVGGPTCSAKSALALRLAERLGGSIVNADSMQQYRDLRLLTARPSLTDQARLPHHLYGTRPAEQPCSVGTWLGQAIRAIDAIKEQGRLPIVVGGTGMYLSALLQGIAPVPEVPSGVRAETGQRFDQLGGPAFHAELMARDPKLAQTLRPSDRQRLIRAAEVLDGTGKSLGHWQAMPRKRAVLPQPVIGFSLDPPRAELHRRIEQRLHGMIEAGALTELEALRARNLDPELPLMKAVTVPEFLAHLEGRTDLGSAIERAIARTRQYAKRQLTWFRHQLPELEVIEAFGDSPDLIAEHGLLPPALLTDRSLPHTVRSAQ